MPNENNLHRGHRERLRERFIKEGIDNFSEHNILELLLFYAIPQKDTNELAHTLLNRFGSLENVLKADFDKLTEVKGIGGHTARFLSVVSRVSELYILSTKQHNQLSGLDKITDFAVETLSSADEEMMMIFLIDNKDMLLGWHVLHKGTVSKDCLDITKLMRIILGTNSTKIMLAHKYLKNKVSLKSVDIAIIDRLTEILKPISVGIKDYVVVGADKSYTSLNMSLERRK